VRATPRRPTRVRLSYPFRQQLREIHVVHDASWVAVVVVARRYRQRDSDKRTDAVRVRNVNIGEARFGRQTETMQWQTAGR